MQFLDEENQSFFPQFQNSENQGSNNNSDEASQVVVGNLCYFLLSLTKVCLGIYFVNCDQEVCNEPFQLWLTFVVGNEIILVIYLLLAIQLYFRNRKFSEIEASFTVSTEEGAHHRRTINFMRNRNNFTMANLNGLDHYNHLNMINEDTEDNFKFLVLLRQIHQL